MLSITLSELVAAHRPRRHTVVLVALVVVVTGLVVPVVTVTADAPPDDAGLNQSESMRSPDSERQLLAAVNRSSSEGTNSSTGTKNATDGASSYATCRGKGPVRGGICNVIENAKRSILGGTLDATQNLARSTIELILRRPVPKNDGQIAVFRPPTNQPLAGAYSGWTSVGLPLGFLVWVVGTGVALASRFRPEAAFATQGFQIEQNLGRNLVLTIGSWWIGAFILHLANGLILAVAPQGDQLVMGPQSGVGSILGTGLLAGLLWVGTAAIVSILLVTILLAYFLCLTFMVFLPVFSALMLFDTGGVIQTVGQFGQKGWDIFIRAAFFPLPAALVLGAGSYVAGGTMAFVESAVAVGGFADVAGTLAFAAVTFVTQLAALVATLWMLMGSRAAKTASGVMAGISGAAMFSRAKQGAKTLAGKAATPSSSSRAGAASSATHGTSSTGSPTGLGNGLLSGSGGASGSGAGNRATNASGALGAGSPDSSAGGIAPFGTPTGGRPSGRSSGSATGSTGPDDGSKTGFGAGSGEGGPITVEGKGDLPGGQDYRVGYVDSGEFQQVEDIALSREMVVKQQDRFAKRYDSDGDHPGVRLLGEKDSTLYDAAPVAGEDWGVSATEAAGMSRDAVFDARGEGGESR